MHLSELRARGLRTEDSQRPLKSSKFSIGSLTRQITASTTTAKVRTPESSHDASICQHGEADSGAAASVRIAQAAVPKESDSDYPSGMESCLKKFVWEAAATGFQDQERAAGSRLSHLEEDIVLGGPDWTQPGVYS